MNEVSMNIWNVFEMATRAGKEANALLDLIESDIISLSDNPKGVKKVEFIKSEDDTDDSEWIHLYETRSYSIFRQGRRSKRDYLLGIQVVMFDEEGCILEPNHAKLNIVLSQNHDDVGAESTNWFSASDDNDWEGYHIQTSGYTICALSDGCLSNEGDEVIFSIPLGALGSPQDVELKVIKPIQALLENLNPNDAAVVKAFENAQDISSLHGVTFPKNRK